MILTGVCPVCGKNKENLAIHISSKTDEIHAQYVENMKQLIDDLLLESDLLLKEISPYLRSKGNIVWESLVYQREKQICPGRSYLVMGKRRAGKNNPVHQDGIKQKISTSVTDKWKDGAYDNRINGMLGKSGEDNPNFNVYSFLGNRYKDVFDFYHKNKRICSYPECDKEIENIHHINEDNKCFLLTNLDGYCVNHHMNNHYLYRKLPFINVTKIFLFDSSHSLLDYNGPCSSVHGHTYKLEVTIRKRIIPTTGMVMDFGDLKKIVNDTVIDKLDHSYMNDVIMEFNTTAENMLIWIWMQLEKEGLLKGLYEVKLWETPTSYAVMTQKDIFYSNYVMSYYYDIFGNKDD